LAVDLELDPERLRRKPTAPPRALPNVFFVVVRVGTSVKKG
jgi:hypothetical protein